MYHIYDTRLIFLADFTHTHTMHAYTRTYIRVIGYRIVRRVLLGISQLTRGGFFQPPF